MSPLDAARAVAARQGGLITTSQAQCIGLKYDDVRTLRRRGEWSAITKGVHLIDAALFSDGLAEKVWWQAALLAEGDAFCLAGLTGAEAMGMVGLPPLRYEIEVGSIGGISRHHRGIEPTILRFGGDERCIKIRQLAFAPDDVVIYNGLRVSCAFRTVVDAGLKVDRPTALALMDSALHLGLLTTDELHASIVQAGGRRGIVVLRELSYLADARAESQVESRVRLACIDGDVPPDELQHTVVDTNGVVLARGDLAWLKRRRPLLGEADGESVHSLPAAVYRDRFRGNDLVGASYDTVRFTFKDTFKKGYIPWVVRRALAAA
jgi:hypothetical protein